MFSNVVMMVVGLRILMGPETACVLRETGSPCVILLPSLSLSLAPPIGTCVRVPSATRTNIPHALTQTNMQHPILRLFPPVSDTKQNNDNDGQAQFRRPHAGRGSLRRLCARHPPPPPAAAAAAAATILHCRRTRSVRCPQHGRGYLLGG